MTPAASEIFGSDPKHPRSFAIVAESRYRLAIASLGLELNADRLRRERHELIGELTVRANWAGAATVNGTLSSADFNFSSARARTDRAKLLRDRSRTKPDDVDWPGIIEEFCQRVLDAERAGQPAVMLRDLPRPTADTTITVAGFPLLLQHPSILFGDGGGLKSYTSLYFAGELARRNIRTLYADWELSADDHRERLERLFGTEMPAVRYVRCARPLVYEADRLRRIVEQERIQFLICDSIAFACNGAPESAEVAGAYFLALRQIGVGSLNIAHVNKSDQGDQKPFGSAFWFNGARSIWFVKAGESSPSGLSIALFNRKANLGPLRSAVGFDISFSDDRTTFERVDVASIDELATGLPLWQRIRQAVRHQPLALHALAADLDAKPESIERTVRRMKQMFTKVAGDDGVYRIALVSREAA